MKAKVYSVGSACFHINKINPPELRVAAGGEVNSTGWSDGKLVPWSYVTPPEDGIQDFDFLATAPSGMVLWVITPIGGEGSIELQDWMKGVRIHSSSGDIEVLFTTEPCGVNLRTIADGAFPQAVA